ncbi:MAG: Pyridine nucleotide-disulfide oxidoreductase, FAD/NAD(P)-binding domain protein [Myxococcales bacterium]|nr:Pyridine nucleotide-disulfide oxidoreductase, FAD/NAD(P)-binding domain protein [Myxococcales bacterium]
MGDTAAPLTGPDLANGIELTAIAEGQSLLGHAHGEAVLLVRPAGSEQVFAIGATCTHYSGPLADGLIVGGQVHCPWHHARFDVTTGDAVSAPALNPLPCWSVERTGSRLIVAEKLARSNRKTPARSPASVVIVGGGAAGNAAAEMLRNEGYAGPITMISADPDPPVDRPNLSKDYLAGTAPEEWIPLRGADFYAANKIALVLGTRVVNLDTKARRIVLSDGTTRDYDTLLLATGADPVKLPLPGSEASHVFYLRTLADSRAIIAKATHSKRAVVLGASFIGLEVAASLRARGLEVHVVGLEARPLEKVLGAALGDFVKAIHVEHGVQFHLGHTIKAIEADKVTLDDGSQVLADLVVIGVGVRPAVALAEQAGLQIDRGVVVDQFLETSAAGVYAAGDIARWPDPRTGHIRAEHWVVAERHGQAAARNMLGRALAFRDVPFFWSQHYDVAIAYVGHAETTDHIEVIGSLADKSSIVVYRAGGKVAAAATINRDKECLEIEALLEREDYAGLEALLVRARSA